MENQIKEKIHALSVEGLNDIRQHLIEKGNINDIEEDCLWFAYFMTNGGDGDSSHISSIELDENSEISMELTNGCWINEDELNVLHIMDILSIIEQGHGNYSES